MASVCMIMMQLASLGFRSMQHLKQSSWIYLTVKQATPNICEPECLIFRVTNTLKQLVRLVLDMLQLFVAILRSMSFASMTNIACINF